MRKGLTSAEHLAELWDKTYNNSTRPDWQYLLPFYGEDIHFRDSIQEFQGIEAFREMIDRLSSRSRELEMAVVSKIMQDNLIIFEWEMSLIFKKRPKSVIYGVSRMTLDEDGFIIKQRDYYDLWGDIFDNIPVFGKQYRNFVQKKFG